MNTINDFFGPNAGYVLELYDRFLRDPSSVDAVTRDFFRNWKPEGVETPVIGNWGTIVAAVTLARNLRQSGHLAAHIDPLGSLPSGDATLTKEHYGLTDAVLAELPASVVGGPLTEVTGSALEAIGELASIYMSSIGFDFEHVHSHDEREWLRDVIEGKQFIPPKMPFDDEGILEKLTAIEVLEQFLQRSFPGKFRFSIEGVDMLVPMLSELVALTSRLSMRSIVIGMAHRGRLNVLAHILQLPYQAIFAEFKDPARNRNSRADLDWTGDVKYHRGAYKIPSTDSTEGLSIFLAPNPSHLEAIGPVIEGMARAAGTSVEGGGKPGFDADVTLPVLIHGDASFPGQGIVAETLNMSRLDGYSTGGTIHIITNNQLGYTAVPHETRSTRYASDLAKGFEVPVIHVNADDPEACIETIRIASAYRAKFHKDFLIDLVGYRRHGHNESDEPTFTQPLMYDRINKLPTVRQKWAETLARRGLISQAKADELVATNFGKLQSALASLVPENALIEQRASVPPFGAAKKVKTSVDLDKLRSLNAKLLSFPQGFSVHPKLERVAEKRRHAFDNPDSATIDWATAETLALASILDQGIPVRLTGQDSDRGTFSHRHITYHDVGNGSQYTPLQSITESQAAFEIHNSPLTENAAIGFEYGYNVQEPERLVIWEAQYGDFINNAQIMVDEFITSARAKWGQTPSLVLLLPHAYEGQGPDHSSGRLERFLELAAETNIRIANCTTAAQYFHLLRRQALLLKTDPLPLIVMTPKGLLRHPRTASVPRELFEGKWQPVIDDPKSDSLTKTAERLILCSGKIFVDLIDSTYRQSNESNAIIRIEQLYPFPAEELEDLLTNYQGIKELRWVQEEPLNMGAWTYVQPRLIELAGDEVRVTCVGREANASPAEGSTALHAAHHAELVSRAFKLEGNMVHDTTLKSEDSI